LKKPNQLNAGALYGVAQSTEDPVCLVVKGFMGLVD